MTHAEHNPPPWDENDLQDRADELFVALFAMPPVERTARLDAAAAGEPALRAAVEELLAAHDEPLGLLDQAESGPEPGVVLSLLPRRIGDYHILGLLGRGGMGVVYRAEQDSPRRHVALKVLPPTDLDRDSLARLRREAEVLGRLQHPGIAQIFGAGSYATALGEQPFFAMELIDGVDLLSHCDANELNRAARCELLAKVCDAVQHAHERGVVHRDLKPGNVLVARPDENTAQPKVLDFGIARTIDPNPQHASLTTQSGLLIGTLSYMSPEQFLQSTADARSDVYALGVMLYELLAGRLPFDFTDKSMTEIHRSLMDDEPEPLQSEGVTPIDLQTIAVRAMAKDPIERYPSAAELAAELRRFLHHEPIHARPLTLRYQLRKFARRHRVFVIGVAATMLALVAGTIVSLTFMSEAQGESARAQRETDRAKRAEYRGELASAVVAVDSDPRAARAALDRVADRAGLEWRILDARLRPWIAVRPMHDKGERLYRLSDGRVVSVTAPAGTLRIADALTDRELHAWSTGESKRFFLSRSGRRAVTWTWSKAIGTRARVWDTATGELVREHEIDRPTGVNCWLDETDRYLLMHCFETSRKHEIVDLETGVVQQRGGFGLARSDPMQSAFWIGHRLVAAEDASDVLQLPYGRSNTTAASEAQAVPSPCGRYVAWRGSAHRNLELFDRKGGKPLLALAGHTSPPWQIGWSADGNRLVSGAADHTLKIWDPHTGACLRTIGLYVSDAVFTADGSELIATRRYDIVFRLPIESSGSRVLRGQRDYVLSGALDPTGRLLASGDTSDYLRLWDLDRGTCLGELKVPDQVNDVMFVDGGRRVVAFLSYGKRVTIDLAQWAIVERGTVKKTDAHPTGQANYYGLDLADGRRIGAVRWKKDDAGLVRELTLTIEAAAAEPRKLVVPLPTDTPGARADVGVGLTGAFDRRQPVRCVDSTGRLLALGLLDGSFAVVDLETETLVARERLHVGPVMAAVFTPDGSRLITGGADGVVRIWDTATWEPMLAERAHDRVVEFLLVDPDGERFVSLSADRTIRIWDTADATELYQRKQQETDARADARAWVDGLWQELADGDAVASRIDAVDPSTPRWVHVLERQLERLVEARK